MKFWFDISTPKEVLFFMPIIEELKRREHKIVITSRKYGETNDLLRYFGVDVRIIGRHGKTNMEKIDVSTKRMVALLDYLYDEKIDCVVSFVNPESCRIAYGLGIPLVNFIDMIEADVVLRLTLPLSTKVFIPFHVSKELLSHYFWRSNPDSVYVYDCLDPVAWMPESPKPIQQIGLPPECFTDTGELRRPFVLYRLAETKASYFTGIEDYTNIVIERLKEKHPEAYFYPLPRYDSHKIIDLQSLLYYVDLFVGGGGSICEESAWWGTRTLSCRPFACTYDKWLIDKGLMYHPNSVELAVKYADFIIKSKLGKNEANLILRAQKFPLIAICDELEKVKLERGEKDVQVRVLPGTEKKTS